MILILPAILIFWYITFSKEDYLFIRIIFIMFNLIYFFSNLSKYNMVIQTNSEYINSIFVSFLFTIYYSTKSIYKDINARLFTAIISAVLLPFLIHSSYIFYLNFNVKSYDIVLTIIYYSVIVLSIIFILIKDRTLKNNPEYEILTPIIFMFVMYFTNAFGYLKEFDYIDVVITLIFVSLYLTINHFSTKHQELQTFKKIIVSILYTGILITITNPITFKNSVKCVVVENENDFNGINLKHSKSVINEFTTLEDCIDKDLKIDKGNGQKTGKVRWNKSYFIFDEKDKLGNY